MDLPLEVKVTQNYPKEFDAIQVSENDTYLKACQLLKNKILEVSNHCHELVNNISSLRNKGSNESLRSYNLLLQEINGYTFEIKSLQEKLGGLKHKEETLKRASKKEGLNILKMQLALRIVLCSDDLKTFTRSKPNSNQDYLKMPPEEIRYYFLIFLFACDPKCLKIKLPGFIGLLINPYQQLEDLKDDELTYSKFFEQFNESLFSRVVKNILGLINQFELNSKPTVNKIKLLEKKLECKLSFFKKLQTKLNNYQANLEGTLLAEIKEMESSKDNYVKLIHRLKEQLPLLEKSNLKKEANNKKIKANLGYCKKMKQQDISTLFPADKQEYDRYLSLDIKTLVFQLLKLYYDIISLFNVEQPSLKLEWNKQIFAEDLKSKRSDFECKSTFFHRIDKSLSEFTEQRKLDEEKKSRQIQSLDKLRSLLGEAKKACDVSCNENLITYFFNSWTSLSIVRFELIEAGMDPIGKPRPPIVSSDNVNEHSIHNLRFGLHLSKAEDDFIFDEKLTLNLQKTSALIIK